MDVADIEYLTSLKDPHKNYKYLNYAGYRQILALTLEKPGKENVLDAIAKLERNPIIRYAGPSRTDLQIDDPIYDVSRDATLRDTEPYYYDMIGLESAWELTTGDSEIQVGVVDSGIANHSDLVGSLGSGWDFCLNNAVTSDDATGHGTHVAGIIHTIAPDATLIPLQVAYGSSYSGLAIVAAVDYAEDNDIPVLNMSLSNGQIDYDLLDSLENYTGVVCCAAGNYYGSNNDLYPRYPACYDLDSIISVAATDDNDELCLFSNYGVQSVDLAAPGYEIYSTYPPNAYSYDSGTSMATPMVTGTVALLLAYNPNLTIDQLRHAILSTVDPLPSLSGYVATGGRLNVGNALSAVLPGNRVRNYLVSIMITSPTDIGYGTADIHYDRGRCKFKSKYTGDSIPVPGSMSYVNLVSNQATTFLYYNYTYPITDVGSFVDAKYNSPFATEDILPYFDMENAFFRDSNNVAITNPPIALQKVLMGDVNMDNIINSADALLALQCATGSISLSDLQIKAADVDLSGAVTSQDALKINQYISQSINTF